MVEEVVAVNENDTKQPYEEKKSKRTIRHGPVHNNKKKFNKDGQSNDDEGWTVAGSKSKKFA